MRGDLRQQRDALIAGMARDGATTAEIRDRFGLSKSQVHRVLTAAGGPVRHNGEAARPISRSVNEPETVEEALERLPAKTRMRVDKLVEALRGRLRKSFDEAVQAEVRRQLAAGQDEVRRQLVEAQALIRGQERLIADMRDRAVFSQSEFRMLQLCCHPDASASAETRARLLQRLVENESRLVRSK